MYSIYELKHSKVIQDDFGVNWLCRDEQTEVEYGDRVLTEVFTRSEDESREDMLRSGYAHVITHDGCEYYLKKD